ncbi:PH domain-containing protein [Temperatibacter marinus]|uniref:PH domain-containing protein n=1 Tax=Temperatibacter marinus TaxID=1456591 RepID=A0AA52HBI5_9PROT|nr:PH domain-containing protein [Temperatibacter marinus]WND03785.1 PH domain-containing protein [Temperatibacter marinus]
MSDSELSIESSPEQEGYELQNWQKVSPLSILHFTIGQIFKFFTQGIQGLLPLLAVGVGAGEKRWLVLGIIALVGGAVLIIGAILTYMKFRYRLHADQVHIQKGVLTRKRLHLDYDRIQNVALEEPLYFRPFNMVVVKIESAGSSGEEVALAGIPREKAAEIRSTVMNYKPQNSLKKEAVTQESAPIDLPAETELLRLSIDELIRYGLSNNNVWIMMGFFGGIMPQIDDMLSSYIKPMFEAGQEAVNGIEYGVAILLVFFLLTVFIVMMLFSILGAIITQYNFRLSRGTDGRFHRSKGLFERQETSLKESKIQAVVFKQGWVAKLLNRWHIYLKQVSFKGQQHQPGQKGDVNLLIPSSTDAFMDRMMGITFPTYKPQEAFSPINKRFIYKTVGLYVLPIATLVAALNWFIHGKLIALVPFLAPVIALPLLYLVWYRYGYQRDDTHGYIRSGFIGQKRTLFAFYKVQTVEVTQSYGQRKTGHAELKIKLAGTSLTIPYMPIEDAYEWRDRILYEVETTEKSFM